LDCKIEYDKILSYIFAVKMSADRTKMESEDKGNQKGRPFRDSTDLQGGQWGTPVWKGRLVFSYHVWFKCSHSIEFM
jgi:hypothetical protein